MKLVDILARELKVWPHPGNALGQAADTTLHLNENASHGGEFYGWTKDKFTRAEDHSYAFVTRAQWQDAVDALKAAENAVPEWSGEGLPPIGIDVEVFAKYSHPRFDRFIGQRVHIVAHDVINGDPVAVFRMPVDGDDTEQDYHAMVAKSFHPLRTPEQTERDKCMTLWLQAVATDYDQATADKCEKILIDAGYRKQVAP